MIVLYTLLFLGGSILSCSISKTDFHLIWQHFCKEPLNKFERVIPIFLENLVETTLSWHVLLVKEKQTRPGFLRKHF
jgi:hypothetical protein